MKADFSRWTFNEHNHYRRVLMQQGRVEIDADPNEQIAIDDHIAAVTSTDVIGQAGYPNGIVNGVPVGGFELGIASGGADLTISAGRMYIDGLLVENDAATTLLTQPDMPEVTLAELGANAAGIYAVYLDVFERVITALDNPLIRETALGGPDTSVRTKLVWQVKLGNVGPAPAAGTATPTCSSVADPWPAASTGTLTAGTGAPTADLPCILPPETGYQSLQNQLYRVEIHTGGDETTATFAWSRENASVVCLIANEPSSNGSPPPATLTGPTFYVNGLNTDPSLGLTQGDWVELSDDNTELVNGPGTLYQVKSTPTDGHHVTLDTATTVTVTTALHPKLRRWDQSGTGLTNGVLNVSTAAPIELEDGVQVQFSKGTYHAGDYWLIPARTATSIQQGYVQWPVDSSGNPIPAPPVGIKHHYAKLGLVEFTLPANAFGGLGSSATPTDCRLPFPPLTELPQQSGQSGQCACTIVVKPGPGWEQPIINYFTHRSIEPDGLDFDLSAEICFPIGEFPLSAPLVIDNADKVVLNGAGWGTTIYGDPKGASQAALVFRNCSSVTVRDLHVLTTGVTAGQVDTAGNRISSGPLTFSDCEDVTVEGVWSRCGGSYYRRAAACIAATSTVTDDDTTTGAGSVRIRGCHLDVGEMQVGIQLIHQNRVMVEDNEITIDPGAATSTLGERLADPGYRAAARALLLSPAPATAVKSSGAVPAKTAPPAKTTARKAVQKPAPTTSQSPTAPPAPGNVGESTADTPSTASTEEAVAPIQRPSVPKSVLNVGNQKVTIAASPALASTWQAWLDTNSPKEFGTKTDANNYLNKAADTILTQASSRANMSEFSKVVTELNNHMPLAARGIVVGGRAVQDVHIANNTLSGVLMGISVGVSHHATGEEVKLEQRTPDHLQTIRITGNTIGCALNDVGLALVGGIAPARFGIFVGNANSLEIDDNRLTLTRATGSKSRPQPDPISIRSGVVIDMQVIAGLLTDAIRVVGYLGAKAILRANHTTRFATGICVIPLTGTGPGKLARSRDADYLAQISSGPQWLVIDNIIENAFDSPTNPPFSTQFTPQPYIDAPRCMLVNNAHLP